MSFEITFLGTSGGPLELGNCAILVKPALLLYSAILESRDRPLFSIDAGSGWHALAEVILSDRRYALETSSPQNGNLGQLALYEDSLQPHEYLNVPYTYPYSKLEGSPLMLLQQIFSKMSALLLSHPHLDHIQAMVLNLAGGCESQEKTTMYGSKFTTDALNTHVFNGVIWPDLVLLGMLELETVTQEKEFSIAQNRYKVTYFEVSHGVVANKGRHEGPYSSLAFLVCDQENSAKMLVFGDFEADSILREEKNSLIWKHVAPFILDGSLKCVILECSTYSRQPGVNLYGHMTPVHVMAELQRLETFCAEKAGKRQSSSFVKNLNVIVTHVKETYDSRDPRRRILEELQQLNDSLGLHLNISIATNGILVVV